MKRRAFLAAGGAGATFALAGAGGYGLARAARPASLPLEIQPARFAVTGAVTEGMVSLSPDAPPPVIRMRQGRPFAADLVNRLEDYTTMHWHGIRVPNAMDGVPYLTQFPLGHGDRYRYAFTPQDAGTYWYHPHCMTMEQMARGLTGVIVVEEAEDPGFDRDLALNLRDFRLGDDGQFIDLFTPRGAARAGTLGTVMTANWRTDFARDLPAGSLLRLRLVASDTTRIYKLFLDGGEGQVVALDGHPLRAPVPWPSENAPLVLSPGQRADLALRLPSEEGRHLRLMALTGARRHPLATLRAVGRNRGRDLRELSALPANPLSEPDLAGATRHEFVFGWSPDGRLPNNGFCGSLGYTFWSINREAWPGDAVAETGPLARLKRGESTILRLRNESPNSHPIHLHGLAFRPVASNKRKVSSNWTDTALLLRNETLDIALVADNPGRWAFHCHVIEHQKTGLAGYIEVA